MLAIAMLVEQGLGVGLVPDIGPALTQGRSLQALALPSATPSVASGREVGLLWLRTSPHIRWIEQLLQCAFSTQAYPLEASGSQ